MNHFDETFVAVPASDENNDEIKEIQDKLTLRFPSLWEVAGEDEVEAAYAFAEEYKVCLSKAKTERMFVQQSVEGLKELGFVDIATKDSLKAGDKVYSTIRNKGLMAAVVGKAPAVEGTNILGAHIDSPRADLKPIPLYEDADLALFKTHYYGGIKKYQWTTVPMALHGFAVRQDGSYVEIHLGDEPGDPVFTFNELLIHLASEQMTRVGNNIVQGEELNLLVGSKPFGTKDTKDKVKLGVLKLLNEQYGLVEADLASAEIQVVPAGAARDVGLDRSFIGGYGQDDRVCSFPALRVIMETELPQKTAVCMLTDKEEIGSDGNTGAQSRMYENFLAELFSKQNGGYDEIGFRKSIENTSMLSADVTNGFDPTFASVSDRLNQAYMGKGMNLAKYTGSRGKSGASDANSEFMAKIILLFKEHNIPWQTGEMGKVDAGGGGTIAKYMANLGMEVIDCGVPVLSMHSPFEVTHKLDVYYTYLAYKCFIDHM